MTSDMKSSVITTQIVIMTTSKETLCTEPNISDSTITLIQSIWRGYSQKKHYSFLKKLSYSSSFFPKLDLLETLTSSPISYTKDHKYIYISGTVYEGQWLGGFRHGIGKATWPDKSSYYGEWSFGYPFGEGTFQHSNGEVFEGKWTNPYSKHSSYPNQKNGFSNL